MESCIIHYIWEVVRIWNSKMSLKITFKITATYPRGKWANQIIVLVVNYGISNTIVLETPQFTTKPAKCDISFILTCPRCRALPSLHALIGVALPWYLFIYIYQAYSLHSLALLGLFFFIVTCELTDWLYPPPNKVVWGVYWFHSVRLSVRPCVRPASCVRSVASTVLVGSISYLYILSSNFRMCVGCKVSCKI